MSSSPSSGDRRGAPARGIASSASPTAFEGARSCQGCRHLYSTWRPERPRGCRAYGFESATWPSAVVTQSSGRSCALREDRGPREAAPPARPRGTHDGGLYG
ncbi:MAG: hypothetical protein PVJ89_06490 [Planctomycetota bacterium]|jgi:hypothetical protein